MESPGNNVRGVLERVRGFRFRLVLESACVGVLAGLVVALFRLALEQAERFLSFLTAFFEEHPLLIPLWFGVLVLLAGLLMLLLRWEPMIAGSGIPQIDGEIRGYWSQTWWRVLLAKFLGCLLAIGAGLSLGRGGPSIQLGAMVGKGFAKLTKRMRMEEKLLMTCGAGAGLSAVFNAPLGGTLFVMEVVHKSFSAEVLLSTLSASVASDFVTRTVFGMKPLFDFSPAGAVPLGDFWLVLLLGAAAGLFGALYNRCVKLSQGLYDKLPGPFQRMLIPCILSGVALFFCPGIMGGGDRLVLASAEGLPLKLLLLLFILKFLYTMVSFGSGAPGGIFIPLLVMGALGGGLFQNAAAAVGFPMDLYALAAFGMAGVFSAVVRAPVTGILLITEMTGNFSLLLFTALVSLTAYATADLLKGRPIFEALLRRTLWKEGKLREQKSGEKVFLEAAVFMGAPACGKQIGEVNLPEHCLIVSVERDGQSLVPRGNTVLRAGDVLTLLCDEYDCAEVSYAMDRQVKDVAP